MRGRVATQEKNSPRPVFAYVHRVSIPYGEEAGLQPLQPITKRKGTELDSVSIPYGEEVGLQLYFARQCTIAEYVSIPYGEEVGLQQRSERHKLSVHALP